jgi:hypothetical protein
MSTVSHQPAADGRRPGRPEPKPTAPYRAISALGVASLVLGVLSILSVLDWVWHPLAAAGIVVGWLALRRISHNPGAYTGPGFAKAGIAMSFVFWAVGAGWLTYVYYTQAPPGYKPISYAVLKLPPGAPPEQRVPPSAEELDGERVYVRGFMVPGRQQSGLKRFFLSDDPGVCSFCAPKPDITQLVEVILLGDLEGEYTTRAVGVGGKLRVETGKPKEQSGDVVEGDLSTAEKRGLTAGQKTVQPAPEKPGGGVIYQIEADYLR